MIQARIRQGQVELQQPVPDEWEGQVVKLLPMTPDDPLDDLEGRLAALHALGLMEYDSGEREGIASMLEAMDRKSRDALQNLMSHRP